MLVSYDNDKKTGDLSDFAPQYQAVMRGMAVEARFRPATIAQWLSLLPAPQSVNRPDTGIVGSASTGSPLQSCNFRVVRTVARIYTPYEEK